MNVRKAYLDNIRWSVVLLVAVYHVFYLFNAAGVPGGLGSFSPVQYQDALLYFVYPWFMVLLFAVAGVSARAALEHKTIGEFIRSRTVRLLVPSTLGLLVFQWVLGYLNVRLSGGLAYMSEMPAPVLYLIFAVSGTGPLWFSQTLWLYSLALALIRRLDRHDAVYHVCGKLPPVVLPALALPLWGAAQLGNVPVITVYRFGIYGAAFLTGYFVLSHERMQVWLERAAVPLLAASCVLGAAYVWVYFGQDYTAAACLRGPFTNVYAWIVTLAVLGCGRAWWNKTTPFTAYMSRAGYGVYVLHYLFALVSCRALKAYTPLPPVVIYPLASICTVAGALACYECLRRIPVMRFAVLGISEKKR